MSNAGVKVGFTSGGISTGAMVGVNANWVAMAGAVVEVGKMSGLSETTNGSNGSGFTSAKDGVGVSGTPHIDADGVPQLVVKRTNKIIIIA